MKHRLIDYWMECAMEVPEQLVGDVVSRVEDLVGQIAIPRHGSRELEAAADALIDAIVRLAGSCGDAELIPRRLVAEIYGIPFFLSGMTHRMPEEMRDAIESAAIEIDVALANFFGPGYPKGLNRRS